MTNADRATIAEHPVLLYDGVCALCNGMVRLVLRHDRGGVFCFAALESDVAKELLGPEASAKEGVALVTAALTPHQVVRRRSDAVVAVLHLLGWRWSARLLAVVPRWLREAGYGLVARARYRVFGKYDACPLPPADARSRFLGLYGSKEMGFRGC